MLTMQLERNINMQSTQDWKSTGWSNDTLAANTAPHSPKSNTSMENTSTRTAQTPHLGQFRNTPPGPTGRSRLGVHHRATRDPGDTSLDH